MFVCTEKILQVILLPRRADGWLRLFTRILEESIGERQWNIAGTRAKGPKRNVIHEYFGIRTLIDILVSKQHIIAIRTPTGIAITTCAG